MKQLYFSILLVLFSLKAFTQDWSPISSNERLYYGSTSTDSITNTIRVFSKETYQGDSIFRFNKVIKDCDTCNEIIAYAFVKQFFQDYAIKHDEMVYEFVGKQGFTINALSEVGDSWYFDADSNITAKITEKNIMSILGVQDSVKTIELSSGEIIKLSKSFGIVSFQEYWADGDYKLLGVGHRAGIRHPDFWDIYDYNIGDEFHYNWHYISGGDYNDSYWGESQWKITSKTINDDGFTYGVHIYEDVDYVLNYKSYTRKYDTIIQYSFFEEFMSFGITNGGVNELAVAPGIGKTKIRTVKIDGISYLYFGNGYYLDNDFVYTGGVYDYNLIQPDYGLTKPKNRFGEDEERTIMYKPGFGMVKNIYGRFELSQVFELTGYIKGKDTVGKILSVIKEIANPLNELIVYPNSAASRVTISMDNYAGGDAEVNVYNTSGQLIISQEHDFTSGELTLDIANLPTGVYYIKIKVNNSIISKKLVIS